MRKAMLCLLAMLLAVSPALAAKRVTVEQLSREIASSSKKKDAKVAGRLYELQLTERLSAKKLAAFEQQLPGPKSRRALVALADQAVFLDPPSAEIPNQPAPSLDEQRAIIAKSIQYVEATLHRMPNLFARRDTIRYQDTPAGLRDPNLNALIPYEPLHPVSRSIATVLYQDGEEVVRTADEQQGAASSTPVGLTTNGEFGPIFTVIYGDLPKSNLSWSHWEQGATGLEAVFRFAVPKASSHYEVEYCCINGQIFKQFSAYHGELALNPTTGTILRLTLIADMDKNDPLAKAALMVEYGPFELGGKTYYCPAKSVSISEAPMQGGGQSSGAPFMVNQTPAYMRGGPVVINDIGGRPEGPLQTMLNETVYDEYHLFRADVQILTANKGKESTPAAAPSAESEPVAAPAEQASVTHVSPAPAAAAPGEAVTAEAATPVVAENAAPAAAAEKPEAPAATSAAAAVPSGVAQAASAEASGAAAAAGVAPAGSSAGEISVEAPSAFPATPNGPGFSLNLNARLVNVDVTAYDKKGRPVTDLTGKDFVIYDDGRKMSIRSFSRVGAEPVKSQEATRVEQTVLYSNRPDEAGNVQSASASAPESSTILYLDPTSLDFRDLNYAREQMLKFLAKLPASEPVGLYVRTGHGFSILAEETTDHEALSQALRKWMPTAPDLQRAQEAEMRNRQQFDTVDSITAMERVNGNMAVPGGDTSDSTGNMGTVSPTVMNERSDPASQAFATLIGVAANLAAIPGHKSLIWVASDNVLANWSDQLAGASISNRGIASIGLRAQEALNNSHVSLYPLDASQLDPMGTDASLQNNSVQLNPAQQTMHPTAGLEASMTGGRTKAQLQQDVRAVQPAVQHMAEATGGRAFPRAGDIIRELNRVVEAGNAAYLLSFSPDTPPDGKYHQITVQVPGRRGIHLQYRAGYLYTKEPTTLQERFRQAVWQPQDEAGIGLSARWNRASQGAAVSLQIAATDISMKQENGRWTDRLNIFLVQRDDTGTHAAVKEQTLVLNLTPETYQKVLHEGIPFAEYVEHARNYGTVRIIVVDENSGRMGSITLPVEAESASPMG